MILFPGTLCENARYLPDNHYTRLPRRHCPPWELLTAKAPTGPGEMSERLSIMCVFDEKTRAITTGDGKKIEPITYGSVPLS